MTWTAIPHTAKTVTVDWAVLIQEPDYLCPRRQENVYFFPVSRHKLDSGDSLELELELENFILQGL